MGIAVIPAPGGGVTQKVQEFTSTGTFTTPSNCSTVEVLLVAGGGGGGFIGNGGSNSRVSSGGGAGGEVITRILPVTPGQSYTVTIGAGGTGSTSATASGGTGGTTSFGSLLSVFGGQGGQSGTSGVGYSFLRMGAGAVSQTSQNMGGSGGGAGGPAQAFLGVGNSGSASVHSIGVIPANQRSVGGGVPFQNLVGTTAQVAGPGTQGFGNGGAPGFVTASSSPQAGFSAVSWMGTGTPGYFDNDTSTRVSPVNSSANTGDGGHGAMTSNVSNTNVNGANGGSGYARITFWS